VCQWPNAPLAVLAAVPTASDPHVVTSGRFYAQQPRAPPLPARGAAQPRGPPSPS
jgi:hypothetical protein